MSRFAAISLAFYVACLVAVVVGMVQAKGCAIQRYGSTAANEDWQQWREAAARQESNIGPVERRVPKSERPPALMLMTDHFPACLGLSLLLTSVLFATFVLMVRGAITVGDEEGEMV